MQLDRKREWAKKYDIKQEYGIIPKDDAKSWQTQKSREPGRQEKDSGEEAKLITFLNGQCLVYRWSERREKN